MARELPLRMTREKLERRATERSLTAHAPTAPAAPLAALVAGEAPRLRVHHAAEPYHAGEPAIRPRSPASDGHVDDDRKERSHAWRRMLARRAARAIAPVASTPAAPGHSLEAALIDQWTAPIADQTAPPELLVEYAPRSAEDASAEKSPPRVRPRERGRDVRTSAEVPMTLGPSDATPTLLAMVDERPPGGPPAIPDATPSAATEDAPLTVGSSSVAAAPSLDPGRAQVPASFGRAVAEPAEDLDLLAERISRILREEARRHGIGI